MASEVGAQRPVRRWSLAPAAPRPLRDDVVVLNPGARDAIVNLTLLRPSRRAVSPRRLQGLRVEEGSRRTVAVPSGHGGFAGVVVLRSTEPVVAERRAYPRAHGDVSSIMGTPLPLGRYDPSPG
ncbi:MAG TPA: hypothetical protein VFS38_07705, partial [Actinomycetota bacterium]|nr:hypothetical protein [Actinomycetota bacterium]